MSFEDETICVWFELNATELIGSLCPISLKLISGLVMDFFWDICKYFGLCFLYNANFLGG